MKNLKFDRPIAFIDLEATGLNPSFDRIVELSIIKIHPDGTQESKSTRINPAIPIPAEATRIHGITDDDVADKPAFSEYAAGLRDFLDNCDIGGFGVKRFDIPMLEAEFRRAGLDFSRQGRHILDAQLIYHTLEPRDLTAAYKKYCGKHLENAHSSEADVWASLEVIEGQLNMYSELPHDVVGLHNFCNPRDVNKIDPVGQLFWSEGEVIIDFGKHKGKSLKYVASSDSEYLQWIIHADFSEEVKAIVAKALDGEFLEPPEALQATENIGEEERNSQDSKELGGRQGRLI